MYRNIRLGTCEYRRDRRSHPTAHGPLSHEAADPVARPGPGRRGRLPRPGQRREQHDRPARSSATCWSGWSSSATSWPGWCSTCPPSSGIVTGRSLPELMGERLTRRWQRWLYWLQAEIVAMATDLAEVIGGAIALNLLFDLPLLGGGVDHRHGLDARARHALPARARGRSSGSIIAMMAIIAIGFSAGIFIHPPDAGATVGGPRAALRGQRFGAARGIHPRRDHHAARDLRPLRAHPRPLRPGRAGGRPAAPHPAGHAGRRHDRPGHRRHGEPRHPAARRGVAAGRRRHRHAWRVRTRRWRRRSAPLVATLFAVGLLASGLASTSVGAYAGAEIMHGLLRVRIPLLLRRLVTLIPALVILWIGFDPTSALVLSQVFLSFGIPFALDPPGHPHRAAPAAGRVGEPVVHDGGGLDHRRVARGAEHRPAGAAAGS